MKVLKRIQRIASALSVRTCNFDEIEAPGTFMEHRWGTLFRVPKEALASGKDPSPKCMARELWLVTRLTNTPDTPVEKARWIAGNLGLRFSF
jgi:hypothetical protein